MNTKRFKLVLAVTALLATTVVNGATTESFAEDWQRKRLFNPTERQLKSEKNGKVFLYVGLTDRDVVRAMNDQFDRIDSMMFASTIVTDASGEPKRNKETGEVVVENDGC